MREAIQSIKGDIHHSGHEALQRIHSLSLQESACLHFHFDNQRAPGLHSHAHGQIVFAPQDLVTVTVDGRVWMASAENGIWIPPDLPHRLSARCDRNTYSLYLAPRIARLLPATAGALEISSLLRELLLRLGGNDTAAKSQSHFLKATITEIQQMLRPARQVTQTAALPKAHPLFDAVAAALARDPIDPRNLNDWARELGVSKRTLSRIVVTTTGMSWRTWRMQLRMAAAVRLLQLGVPVKTAAYDLGYAGPTPFIAAFTHNFGITPGQIANLDKKH